MNFTHVPVTIAIPFYNAEQFFEKAIESVIDQSFSSWNLLLVDDGSTDSSMRIAKSYAEKDNRIKVISDGQNKNLGFRLNQIPTLVSTEYLVRMDADDIMHPKKIEKQLTIFKENPYIDVLGTNAYSIDENDQVFGIRYNPDSSYLADVTSFIHPTIMAKTKWFLDNPYDDKAIRIEDTELWYRTLENNNFKMITEPLFFYREVGKDYYKKYFKANDAKPYILKKYKNAPFWKKFFAGNVLKGLSYYIFNLLGKENYLIRRRNSIIMKKKNLNLFVYND